MYEPPKARLGELPPPRTTLRHGFLFGWLAIVLGVVVCAILLVVLAIYRNITHEDYSNEFLGIACLLALLGPVLLLGIAQLSKRRFASALGVAIALVTAIGLVVTLTTYDIPPFDKV